MDSDGLVLGGEVILDNPKEVLDNVVRGSRPVDEEQAAPGESFLFVLHLVQSDDLIHADVVEDVYVLGWMVPVAVPLVTLLHRAHEGHEFVRDNPVKVTVFDLFVVFVFLYVKGFEVVPPESLGVLQALQNVQNCAAVEAVTLGCVSVVLEQWLVGLEHRVGLLSSLFKDNDHKGSHEECAVDHPMAWVL